MGRRVSSTVEQRADQPVSGRGEEPDVPGEVMPFAELHEQHAWHEEVEREQVEVPQRQRPRELEEERNGQHQRPVEPGRRARQLKVEKDRHFVPSKAPAIVVLTTPARASFRLALDARFAGRLRFRPYDPHNRRSRRHGPPRLAVPRIRCSRSTPELRRLLRRFAIVHCDEPLVNPRAAIHALTPPVIVERGATFTIALRVQNLGREAWTSQGQCPVQLRAKWRTSRKQPTDRRDFLIGLPRAILPGDTLDIPASLAAPDAVGQFLLEVAPGAGRRPSVRHSSTASRPGSTCRSSPPPSRRSTTTRSTPPRTSTQDYWTVVGPPTQEEFHRLSAVKLGQLREQGLTPDSHVLDVGCGTGQLTAALHDYLSDSGLYFGTDVGPEAIEFCKEQYPRRNFHFAVNDFTNLPVAPHRFDIACFFSVFTHTYPDETVLLLAETARVLKPNGHHPRRRVHLAADRSLCRQPRGRRSQPRALPAARRSGRAERPRSSPRGTGRSTPAARCCASRNADLHTKCQMRILLTNDDGIYAPGLRALRKELQTLGEVIVVAPATEQSAAGHSVTLLTPLLINEVFEDGDVPRLGRRGPAGRLRQARPARTAARAAGPDRQRPERRVERGDQRALLRHRRRRHRGGLLPPHGHRLLARIRQEDLRLPDGGAVRPAGGRADPGAEAGRRAASST